MQYCTAFARFPSSDSGGVSMITQKHDGPIEIKTEVHFAESRLNHRRPQTAPIVGVKQQEATSARTYQLAAGCSAAFARQVVKLVHPLVSHTCRTTALAHPMFVHKLAEVADVSGFQGVSDLEAELLDEMETLEHLGVALSDPLFWSSHLFGAARPYPAKNQLHPRANFQSARC